MSLPELPEQLIERFQRDLRLSEYDAQVICDGTGCGELVPGPDRPYQQLVKAAANWMLGPVKSSLNEKGLSLEGAPVSRARWRG